MVEIIIFGFRILLSLFILWCYCSCFWGLARNIVNTHNIDLTGGKGGLWNKDLLVFYNLGLIR